MGVVALLSSRPVLARSREGSLGMVVKKGPEMIRVHCSGECRNNGRSGRNRKVVKSFVHLYLPSGNSCSKQVDKPSREARNEHREDWSFRFRSDRRWNFTTSQTIHQNIFVRKVNKVG